MICVAVCYKRNKALTCKFQLYVASAQVTLQTTFTYTLEAERCLPYGSIFPFSFPIKLTAILSSFSKRTDKSYARLVPVINLPCTIITHIFSFEISSWTQKLIFAYGGLLAPKKNLKCQPIIGSLMSGHDISEFDVFNLCRH